MVQALVKLNENTNRVLNTVKSKYQLKDKGQAIEFVVAQYIETENDPELRPEYIKKLERIMKQPSIPVDDVYEFFGVERDVSKGDKARPGKETKQIKKSKAPSRSSTKN